MAARSLFRSLTRRIAHGENRRILHFRSLSSSSSSEVSDMRQEFITRTEFVDDEADIEEKDGLKSRIFRVRLPKRSVTNVLQRWVGEGNQITISDLRTISKDLRKSHRYKHAFEAEDLYEQIKGANLSLSAITYNELMTLYMSVGQLEKVPSIVADMKSKNVGPDLFTYNLWISSCAAALNVEEVTKILDEMSIDPGCDENWTRYKNLVKIYISTSNLVNSDLSSLVETEKGVTQRELISYDFLVILFGSLGNKVKLDEIWKSLRMTRQKLTGRNYVCVLSSYLMLGHLKEVGDIVDEWKQSATSEYNVSSCNKLVEAFKEVRMSDEATSLQEILGGKGE